MTRTILLLLALVTLGACQTFQYSRGWTNGKRAGTIVNDIGPVDDKYSNEAPVEADKPLKILTGGEQVYNTEIFNFFIDSFF